MTRAAACTARPRARLSTPSISAVCTPVRLASPGSWMPALILMAACNVNCDREPDLGPDPRSAANFGVASSRARTLSPAPHPAGLTFWVLRAHAVHRFAPTRLAGVLSLCLLLVTLGGGTALGSSA